MRILQVVTYISPDGAYGGPVRVAINQAKALRDMGHEVVVAAAASGFGSTLPEYFDGFPVRLFPGQRIVPNSGFAGLTSPRLLAWLATAVKSADVVHIHLARDLVTLPAAALALILRRPIIVQTHGMIDQTNKLLAGPLDQFLTQPVLRRARTVLYLTERERQDLIEVAGESLDLAHLPNGVVVSGIQAVEQRNGPQPEPEVLYLARLHRRKRPMFVVRTAEALRNRHPKAQFTLVGPDEGEGGPVRAAIRAGGLSDKVIWSGFVPPEKTLDRLSRAGIYVLPSTDEPFPMAVLEAMSLGLPVVVTKSCGLAPLVQHEQAGIVCGHAQEEFTEAVNRLLDDPHRRIEMGQKARQAVEKLHSMDVIAEKLSNIYYAARTPRQVLV